MVNAWSEKCRLEGPDAHKVLDRSFWAGQGVIHKKPAVGMATSEKAVQVGRTETLASGAY